MAEVFDSPEWNGAVDNLQQRMLAHAARGKADADFAELGRDLAREGIAQDESEGMVIAIALLLARLFKSPSRAIEVETLTVRQQDADGIPVRVDKTKAKISTTCAIAVLLGAASEFASAAGTAAPTKPERSRAIGFRTH